MMCSMDGCEQKQGLCGHEKMMMAILVLAAIAGVVFFYI